MKTLCASVLSLALLGACGDISEHGIGSTASIATEIESASAPTSTPNLAEESEFGPGDRASTPPSDPAAMPADHAARTRPGLYLHRADAEGWERRLRDKVVWLDAGVDAEMALLMAYGMQAARNLGNDTPFFVGGGDLRLAATIVNRLAETGSPQSYLVTP